MRNKNMNLKMNRNIINNDMYYSKISKGNSSDGLIASTNKDIVDYRSYKSAYNPNYPDVGKIVRIPENYLYPNERHHLKDFIIIDGKEDKHGNQVIIGFLGTSKKNCKVRELTQSGISNEIIGITKIIIDKNRYHKLIKKSKTSISNRILTNLQLIEIIDQSRTHTNVNKSKKFRK